jgi:hypothetical protein
VNGEFSKKSRPDIIKMHEVISYNKWDYLVEYTYEILFELGVVDYFADKISVLIDVVSKNNSYNLKKEELPF